MSLLRQGLALRQEEYIILTHLHIPEDFFVGRGEILLHVLAAAAGGYCPGGANCDPAQGCCALSPCLVYQLSLSWIQVSEVSVKKFLIPHWEWFCCKTCRMSTWQSWWFSEANLGNSFLGFLGFSVQGSLIGVTIAIRLLRDLRHGLHRKLPSLLGVLLRRVGGGSGLWAPDSALPL